MPQSVFSKDTTEWREWISNRDRVGYEPGALTTRPRCRQHVFMQDVADQDNALTTASLSCHSEEVAYTIAGYALKKLCKKSKCIACKKLLAGHNSAIPYFQLLLLGGLTGSSPSLADFFRNGFAILDAANAMI